MRLFLLPGDETVANRPVYRKHRLLSSSPSLTDVPVRPIIKVVEWPVQIQWSPAN